MIVAIKTIILPKLLTIFLNLDPKNQIIKNINITQGIPVPGIRVYLTFIKFNELTYPLS